MAGKVHKSAITFTTTVCLVLFLLCGVLCGAAAAKGSAQTQKKVKEPTIHYIWEFKNPLGLTDAQVAKLQQIYQEDKRATMQYQADYEVGQAELQHLIDKNAGVDAIKAQLEKNAQIQVELQLADIVKTRKIKAVLSPVQLQNWLKIQRKINEEAAELRKQEEP